VDWRAEYLLDGQNEFENGMLTEGTEWTGERNVDKEGQNGLENGIFTEGAGWTGERNVDWRDGTDWRTEC